MNLGIKAFRDSGIQELKTEIHPFALRREPCAVRPVQFTDCDLF
jgi:hypothetical protein